MSGTVTEPFETVQIRAGAYHDSVSLMQASRALSEPEGVLIGQVAMGTDLNVGLLRGLGFAIGDEVGSTDLIIAVRASDAEALAVALAAVDPVLSSGSRPVGSGVGLGGTGGRPVAARTLRSAAQADPAAGLALISLPGEHAFTEAMDAVETGLNVMVFSDNVPVEQEIRLKDAAAARGRLVMGPDCGTAVIAGVGLGFANVTRPGPVGIVAASGTGAQQLMCLLDAAEVGISHCLGVGGRDLSAEVAGRSARQALALLDADPATELIVVVSKPPAAQVAHDLQAFADTLITPVQFALLGAGQPDLTAAAEQVVTALGRPWQPPRHWAPVVPPEPEAQRGAGLGAEPSGGSVPRFGSVRGAFAGGTLCDEAMLIAAAELGPIASNIPLPGAPSLGPDLLPVGGGHAMIDFGDDELTRGRPHPMIDGSLRADWIRRQVPSVPTGPRRRTAEPTAHADLAESADGIVLLLDVVLGHGAHADPAAELAPAISAAQVAALAAGIPCAVVVSLCGSSGDPQGLHQQANALADVGATVYLSNAAAARAAVAMIGSGRNA